jgi:hypothetical protein
VDEILTRRFRMKIGDKVKTPDGSIEKVQETKRDLVCTEESSRTGTWYSTNDLIPVYKSDFLQKYAISDKE